MIYPSPASSKNWTRENICWLAGLIEGEGCIHLEKNSQTFRISLAMTDEDVIRKAREIAGMGVVRAQKTYPNRKPSWEWRAGASRQAYALCMAILPFMGIRRSTKIIETAKAWIAKKTIRHPRRFDDLEHGDVRKYRRDCGCGLCRNSYYYLQLPHRLKSREYRGSFVDIGA